MKKIILGIVFVFATVSFTNAKSKQVENTDSIKSIEKVGANCFQDAWDYGTTYGFDEYSRWAYTNKYYNEHCV